MTYGLQPIPIRPRESQLANEASVFEAVRGRLIRLAVKLIWNRDDAEEIVQEAFKLAWAAGLALTSDALLPWTRRTVGNLCLNHRRRRKPEALAEWMDRPSGETPDTSAARVEELESLRVAMEKLPNQQRLALTLRAMEQMPYEKIAEIMEVTPSTVRAHVHQGRQKLAELLRHKGGNKS